MNNKNIIYNHSLEQYNKKYRNRRHRLLKYTKKQVEDFDKQYGHYIYNGKTHNLEFNNYLLENRKWWFTKEDECYHEIPRPVRFVWFRNLSVGAQAATCLLGASIVATVIAVPTIMLTNNSEINFNTNNKDVELVKQAVDKDTNDTVITLKSKKDGVSITSVEVKKGDVVLKEHIDYSYNDATLEIRIHENAMGIPGKITITPKITNDVEHVNQQTWIQAYTPYSQKFEQFCSSSLHYNIEDLSVSGLFLDETGKKFETNIHPFPIQYRTESIATENDTIETNAFYLDFTKGTDAKFYRKCLGGGSFDYRVIQKQIFEKTYEVECDFDYIINAKENYVKYDMYVKGTKNLFNSVKFNSNGFIENTYTNVNLGSQLLIKYNGNPVREEHVQQYAMVGAGGQIAQGKQSGTALYKFSATTINLKAGCDYRLYLRTGLYDKNNTQELCKCGFKFLILSGNVASKISDLKMSITGYEGFTTFSQYDTQSNATYIFAYKNPSQIIVNEMDKDVYLSFHADSDISSINIMATGNAFPL